MKQGFARIQFNNTVYWCSIDLENNIVQVLSDSYLCSPIKTKKTFQFDDKHMRLLAPTIPTKIVCLGLNFKDHANELNLPQPQQPIIFMKPPSSVIGHGDSIVYPKTVKELHYEAEVAFVIKKKAKNVRPQEFHRYVLGFTCFNDVTARDLQKKDGQWTRSKSFDTFAPIGPYIVPLPNIKHLQIQTLLNDKIMQHSTTDNMIFSEKFIFSYISQIMTLYPGDIITLGTPPGVGPMHSQDKITIAIESIGALTNYVTDENKNK